MWNVYTKYRSVVYNCTNGECVQLAKTARAAGAAAQIPLGKGAYSAPDDCVTVPSMVNIARLTIWSIYCSREEGEGRADPLIVAPFIGAA